MKAIIGKSMFLLLLLILPACSTIKNYYGPEVPADQAVTIGLKRPAMALVPLFWVFPLNMLTWFAEDWRETSSGREILVRERKADELEERKIRLNRFVTVSAVPGMQVAETEIIKSKSRTIPIGIEKCIEHNRSKTDDKGNDVPGCEVVTSCSTPYMKTTQDFKCRLAFEAKAGRHYELFIRDGHLSLFEPDSRLIKTAKCDWGPKYSFRNEDPSPWERESRTTGCAYP